MLATFSDIPTYAIWALLLVLGGALVAHGLRVSRERHKSALEEKKKAGDSSAIYKFLLQSQNEGRFDFRSTEAISAHTKLTAQRVEELCSSHPKILRNEKARETWRIVS